VALLIKLLEEIEAGEAEDAMAQSEDLTATPTPRTVPVCRRLSEFKIQPRDSHETVSRKQGGFTSM
jgi:hypothetical protein